MATTTELMFTMLPAGGEASPYGMSMFLSPRLSDAGGADRTLGDYALGNWPDALKQRLTSSPRLDVDFDPTGSFPVDVSQDYIDQLDPVLWDKIFPSSTFVRSFAFQDNSKRWIRSYPIAETEAYIQKLYDDVANASPDAFPDLLGQNPLSELVDAISVMKPRIDPYLPPERQYERPRTYPPVPQRAPATHPDAEIENVLASLSGNVPLDALFLAIRFFKRGNQRPYRSKYDAYPPQALRDPPEPPKFDFHQAIAALGDYPYLLKKLGLILPGQVDAPLPAAGRVRVRSGAVAFVPGVVELRPWTRFQITSPGIGFRPQERVDGDLEQMMLRLDDPGRFGVLQTDPDGNVIKVFDLGVNMAGYRKLVLEERARNPEAKVNQGPVETSLPALRHGGIMVVRHERDETLWSKVAAQAVLQANVAASDNEIWADDLLRGYRVDIHDGSGWFSLMRRGGSYDVAGNPIEQPMPDEGYVKAESATSDDEDPPSGPEPDLYTHGAIVNWTNWSLAAEVPGRAIIPDVQDGAHQTEKTRFGKNAPGAGFDISVEFKAEKKSLPALRFGRQYQVRARATWLDGQSLDPPPSNLFPAPGPNQPPAGVGETPPIWYRRYDPVPAPMLVLTAPVTEGEAMEELVIRSRGGVGTPKPLPNGWDALFNTTNVRWVAAPKATVGMVELHGKFDDLFTQPPSVSRDLLGKEKGNFADVTPADPANPHQATLIDGTGQVRTLADPELADWNPGDALPNGWYTVRQDDPLPLPYLPDPLAHGAMFMYRVGKKQKKAFSYRAYETSAWHDAAPFKLVLVGTEDKQPSLVDALGELQALVPKGKQLEVRYASAVVPPDGLPSPEPAHGELELMGRWHGLTADGKKAVRKNKYQHWMLTPFRTLTLVHAVEKPLKKPKLTLLQTGNKEPGDTFAKLANGKTKLHSESTGEIELRAHWQDFVDDPAQDPTTPEGMPHLEDRDGHVLDQKVDYGVQPTIGHTSLKLTKTRHELGDTKHRWIYYYLVATTRYREYFPHALSDYEKLKKDSNGIVRKQKLISLAGPEYVDNDGLALNVLNSGRPSPPSVQYLVPTFEWVDVNNGRRRRGRGLRIYLARPWHETGVDELLGIVLMPNPAPSNHVEMRSLVSEWGSDPLFDRSGPVEYLAPSNFEKKSAAPPVVLPLVDSLDGSTVSALVYSVEPQFDPERNLWFADLVFGPTTHYYTFVRLAVCRFQPFSVGGFELSKVVRTEFAQLLGDRTATLTFNTTSIHVRIRGEAGLSEAGQMFGRVGGGYRFVARLEQRPLGSDSDLDWVLAPGGASEVELATTDATRWDGNITWPRTDLPTTQEYRLAVHEYERWQTDAGHGTPIPGTPFHVAERLVYVDHFKL